LRVTEDDINANLDGVTAEIVDIYWRRVGLRTG
jgi:hypothetical protein